MDIYTYHDGQKQHLGKVRETVMEGDFIYPNPIIKPDEVNTIFKVVSVYSDGCIVEPVKADDMHFHSTVTVEISVHKHLLQSEEVLARQVDYFITDLDNYLFTHSRTNKLISGKVRSNSNED